MANSNDFGKEVGLVHKVLVAGRDIGADREFWIKLSEDRELFTKVVSLVKGTANFDPVYTVSADAILSPFQAMIEMGRYDWVNPDITEAHFPLKPNGSADPYRGSQEVELHLIHFGRDMKTEEVLQDLDKRGLRPVTFQELCALGAAHPELQRQFPIVALGSQWRNSDVFVRVPILGEDDRERFLDLHWDSPSRLWGDYCRFLAVSK